MALYKKEDEKFGVALAIIYAVAARIAPSMRRFYDFAAEDIREAGFSRVLDVGCGPGDVAIKVSAFCKDVTAIDPSEAMVWIAKHRKSKVKFLLGSSRAPNAKGKFGLIYSTLSFHHWPDKARSLAVLGRMLSKGGEIRIYEFRRAKGIKSAANKHSMDMDALKEAAFESGLRIVSVKRTKEFIRATLKF
ncbi:MAG: class I SAM-dependent methyltransferase [Candidatus Micrarchaeaceae archaeon]